MLTIVARILVNVVVKNVKMMQNAQHLPLLKQTHKHAQKHKPKLRLRLQQKQDPLQTPKQKQAHLLKLKVSLLPTQILSVALRLHYRNALKQIAITTIIIAIIAVHVRQDVLNSLIAAQEKVLDIK
jgi:hypothetical protein